MEDQRYKLDGNLKIANPEKLKGQNITLGIEYTVLDYVCTGANIPKINIRNTSAVVTKTVKQGFFAEIEMRLSGLL